MNLIRQLLPSQDIDALLGDIAEEARHRSRLWCWAQLAAVLVAGSAHDVRRHPIVGLRAFGAGLFTLMIYFTLVIVVARAVDVLANGGYYLAGHWLTLPPHQLPPRPLTAFVVNTLGFASGGWAIGRTHRAHGIAMVVPYVVAMTLLAIVSVAIVLADRGPGIRALPWSGVAAIVALVFASFTGGSLLGGLVGVWPTTKERMGRH